MGDMCISCCDSFTLRKYKEEPEEYDGEDCDIDYLLTQMMEEVDLLTREGPSLMKALIFCVESVRKAMGEGTIFHGGEYETANDILHQHQFIIELNQTTLNKIHSYKTSLGEEPTLPLRSESRRYTMDKQDSHISSVASSWVCKTDTNTTACSIGNIGTGDAAAGGSNVTVVNPLTENAALNPHDAAAGGSDVTVVNTMNENAALNQHEMQKIDALLVAMDSELKQVLHEEGSVMKQDSHGDLAVSASVGGILIKVRSLMTYAATLSSELRRVSAELETVKRKNVMKSVKGTLRPVAAESQYRPFWETLCCVPRDTAQHPSRPIELRRPASFPQASAGSRDGISGEL